MHREELEGRLLGGYNDRKPGAHMEIPGNGKG